MDGIKDGDAPNAFGGMQVMLMEPSGRFITLRLPGGRPRGRFTLEAEGIDCFRVEARDGRWYAVSTGAAWFANCPPDQKHCVALTDQCLLIIRLETVNYILYAEEVTWERAVFHNYRILAAEELRIGRVQGNDIQYDMPLVSSTHAILRYRGDHWEVSDHDSLNGTYLNGHKVRDAGLKMGDVLYIVGLRIILGAGFISMNCGGRPVYVNAARLVPLRQEQRLPVPPAGGGEGQELFNRQPRRRQALNPEPIALEGPPMSINQNHMPLLLRMGSSMVMGTTAMLAGRFTTMLSSVLFPMLSHNYTEKERKEYEERRVATYLKYLAKKEAEINEERRREESVLNWNYPELRQVLQFPETGKRLWERQRSDDDFLQVRVGVGDLPLLAELKYPREKFSMDEDPMEQRMHDLAEMPVTLHEVPIQTSLVEDFVCGVSGFQRLRMEFVRNFLLQLTALHSYDEVKVVFLGDDEASGCFDFVRYLPHVWNDRRTFRFMAYTPVDAAQISEYLKRELEEDLARPKKLRELLKTRPYYVVFALNKKLFDSLEILKDILQEEQNLGVSVVAAFDDLPKECSKIFRLNSTGEHAILYLKQPDRPSDNFRLDSCDPDCVRESMRRMANISLRVVSQAYALPKMLTFLEMFGVGRIEHLNVQKRWQDNNPVQSLAAPVGVATDGTRFTLDLHEKFQGPHGLVAGMTGSGKSEFIITYILSMAVNFHPDEVAFILIDYKGGGLAGAFDDPQNGLHLPHLIGTITNLDGSAIQRSLLSIQSELTRRQRIFNEVKRAVREGTMDIYSYQKLYRMGRVREPLPHLFIISDEFAELKKQQPEFMDQLISAARIGRSLGVHLILATQKPSGVVNDQILSNTKFRVCLRVQDRMDSMDMLKRPEAAELTDTGRFYLQVGYNEFFALGQSAWCGADYQPQDKVAVQRDDAVQFLDSTGRTFLQVRPETARKQSGMKQIVAVVRYLSDLAKQEGIRPRLLWKEPLPDILLLEDLRARWRMEPDGPVGAVIGLVDDPERQRQFPLTVDLQNCRNLMLAGESGSGKSTLLQTMLYDLATRYSPEALNFYILDFSSRMLSVFRDLPHCGAFLSEDDEDAVGRLFHLLTDIIKKRKKLFSDADVNSYEDYLKKSKLPLILVVIDNAAGLTALKNGSYYFNALSGYMKDGAGVGIVFVLSVSHMNEVSTKARQEAGTRLALRLKDKFEYGDVLNRKCAYVPPAKNGRGMVCVEERPLEYHTAMVGSAEHGQQKMTVLREALRRVSDRYADYSMEFRLPVIQEDEEFETFSQKFAAGRFPLGYALPDIKAVALPLKQFYALSLYFGNPNGVAPVVHNILHAAAREQMRVLIVKRLHHSMFASPCSGPVPAAEFFEATSQGIDRLWKLMAEEIGARKRLRNEYAQRNGISLEYPGLMQSAAPYIAKNSRPLLILMESFYDLAVHADEAGRTVLSAIFQSGRGYHYYMAGCFYPDDAAALTGNVLYQSFNPDQMNLFFGGQFHRQGLQRLPQQYQSLERVSPLYNRGLMNYRGQVYPFWMPCGPIQVNRIDEDDAPIFDG